MADTARSSTVLKTYFETGDIPTQQQFADWLTSYANIVDLNTLLDTETAITAHAGGGQGSAYALTKFQSAIGTVATTGDSVLLPSALVNRSGLVINYSANAADVFPVSGQEIDGLGVNVQVSLPAGYAMFYYCLFNSEWYFEMKSLAGINVVPAFVTTSAAALTPLLEHYNTFTFTALAAALTINAPTRIFGEGQEFSIVITDNGTARALTWNGVFLGVGANLPSTTILGKKMILRFKYNAADTKWMLLSSFVEGYAQVPYKTATFLISQAGTAAPTAVVLDNNTGLTFSFTRDGVGLYEMTPSVKPALAKTLALQGNVASDGSVVAFTTDSGDVWWTLNTFAAGGAASDDVLNRFSLEIRIYP